MLQRCGTAKSRSGVSSAQACPVMLFRQVRNGHEQPPLGVERDVAVHHRAEAHGRDGLEVHGIAGADVLRRATA